jgi:hypothetical protein
MARDLGDSLGDEEIARRRDDAIRRALNTPPKSLKDYVGKSERAIAQRESRVKKAPRSKPKSP